MKKVKQSVTLLMATVLMILCVVPVSASDLPFTDVPENYVKYDAIKFVYENGIMNGVSDTLFNPSGLVERAMIVTILYRLEGEPVYYDEPPFTDIDESMYYYEAVCWAYENDIVKGKTATTFEPYTTVSLQEILTFLYRYRAFVDGSDTPDCVLPIPTRMTSRIGLSGYTYVISNFAKDAVNWACNVGIIDDAQRYFNGEETAIRATCADLLYKFMTLTYGNARVFATDDFTTFGPVEYVASCIDYLGYESHIQYDLYPVAMEYAFYNSNVVYSSSHGAADCIELANKYLLTSNMIDEGCMENAELVYIFACQSGRDFAQRLYEVGGAQQVIGFTENVTSIINTTDGGGHYFTKIFFDYWRTGLYTVDDCVDMAQTAMERRYDNWEVYGTQSCVVYQD